MSITPYIYLFLKDETGTSISYISLFSKVPTKQVYKTIADKIKLPKNKVIELKYKGELLDENLSLSAQNVAPYSDIFVFVKNIICAKIKIFSLGKKLLTKEGMIRAESLKNAPIS